MNSKVIVALDYETEREALNFVDQVDPSLCRLKVGKEMFTSLGINFVKQLQNRKFDVFLDLKYHDIPNTVARAVRSAADSCFWRFSHDGTSEKNSRTLWKRCPIINCGNGFNKYGRFRLVANWN